MRSLAITILVASLALAPVTQAQVPPGVPSGTPVYHVTIADAPAEFPALSANATVQAPFRVVLVIENVFCPQAETIPVTLTATAAGAPGFFGVVLEPNTINITIAQGPHVGSPGGGSGDSVAKATVTGNITTNASVSVDVVASAPAPTSCQGGGAIGAATSEPVTIFANMTAPPPPLEPEPTDEDTPGFTAFAALAAVGVALLARRSRA